jgi:HEAT repeat protein
MPSQTFRTHWLLAIVVCSASLVYSGYVAAPARAQEEAEAALDEPAADEPAMEDLPADEEAKPAADKPKPKPADEEESEAEPAAEDPALQAVLESHPQTPAELLRAIDILVDLGHANLAKPFIDELAKRELDVTALAALAGQFNSAKLLKLSRNAELDPALAPFIDKLFKSAETYRRDPARLAAWADQLADQNENVRAQAVLALVRAREAAVAPLVAILADPKRASEQTMAKTVLVQLGDLAIEPLLGGLESPDAGLKTQVIDVLGQLRAPQAVPQLLAPFVSPASTPELRAAAERALANIADRPPTRAEALQLLANAARRWLDQSREGSDEVSTPTEVWHWNARRGQSMSVTYDARGAALATAVRLARDLYRLAPHQPSARRLYLEAVLQAAKVRGGLDKPLPTGAGTAHAVAEHFGVDLVEEVLIDAMANKHLAAATAAAEILGDIGTEDLLMRGGSAGSPLARAAAHADRRLRFAATSAIMKLTPTVPFAGSSHVADGLGFFASAYGVPRALVVHPRSEDAQKVAGLAAGLGYDADIATNGRRAFELATSTSDLEFIFIHSAIDRPSVDELVAQLRRDRRTALLPIGLIAPLDDLDRVRQFARSSSRTEAFLQPQNAAQMQLFTARVLARAGQDRISAEERKRQAIAALDWLAALGETPSVFDLKRQEPSVVQVLYVPELSARAATVLGQLASVNGQRSLLELADLETQSLVARQAAAAAFARSVRKYGIMLTRAEILEQYGLYNGNAGRNADTSAVLGAILDAIEQKDDSPRER